jgi:hypothetical protein
MAPHATSFVLVSPLYVKAPQVAKDNGKIGETGIINMCLIECMMCRSVSWIELHFDAAFLQCFRDG